MLREYNEYSCFTNCCPMELSSPELHKQNDSSIMCSDCCLDGGIMKCVLLMLSALVAHTTVIDGQGLSVSDSMAARVDAQAVRVDRLTKQFQAISDLADGARAAAKYGGDFARHLMITHTIDEWCPPHRRQCGKSPQCISVLAFCDGVNDCKNHYDENPERCVIPLEVNSTWIAYPVYDNCWMGGDTTEFTMTVVSAAPSNIYKGHENMKISVDLSAMKRHNRQVYSLYLECCYDTGTQGMILHAFDSQRISMIGQFDGVCNDRFTHYLYHEASGDECAEYRVFKQ